MGKDAIAQRKPSRKGGDGPCAAIASAFALVTLLAHVGKLGAAAATAYTIVDLGTPPRSYDPLVRGFNSRGQLVGASPTPESGPRGFC